MSSMAPKASRASRCDNSSPTAALCSRTGECGTTKPSVATNQGCLPCEGGILTSVDGIPFAACSRHGPSRCRPDSAAHDPGVTGLQYTVPVHADADIKRGQTDCTCCVASPRVACGLKICGLCVTWQHCKTGCCGFFRPQVLVS